MAWDGEEAWIVPDSITQINPRFWATTGYYFEQIPFVLSDPGLRYEALPPDTLGDTAYDMVRVGFDEGVGERPRWRQISRTGCGRSPTFYGACQPSSTHSRETTHSTMCLKWGGGQALTPLSSLYAVPVDKAQDFV